MLRHTANGIIEETRFTTRIVVCFVEDKCDGVGELG